MGFTDATIPWVPYAARARVLVIGWFFGCVAQDASRINDTIHSKVCGLKDRVCNFNGLPRPPVSNIDRL
jgi:hypothetical protein